MTEHNRLTDAGAKAELLACPLCKGKAAYTWNPMFSDDSMATCISCGCTAFWKKWNQRPTDPALREQNAALVETGKGADAIALDGYRAALSYVAADSWDGCDDCIEILKDASRTDIFRPSWTPDENARAIADLRSRANGGDVPSRFAPPALAEQNAALGPCPVCNGDCSSANPPVMFCPMQRIAELERAIVQERKDSAERYSQAMKSVDFYDVKAAVAEARTDALLAEQNAALVEAAKRSLEGWENAVELGLIPERHRNTATILADELRAALTIRKDDPKV
jgi:hypothetical protein